jgi:DNA-binding GntR family transcriptional regulator
MTDEIRLQGELTLDTFVSSVGEKVLVLRRDRDVLLTAKMLSKLYGVNISTVRKALRVLYRSGVLDKKSVSEILPHRADDGKLYETRYYNEQAIVELGLHLRSDVAREFRGWVEQQKEALPNNH